MNKREHVTWMKSDSLDQEVQDYVVKRRFVDDTMYSWQNDYAKIKQGQHNTRAIAIDDLS